MQILDTGTGKQGSPRAGEGPRGRQGSTCCSTRRLDAAKLESTRMPSASGTGKTLAGTYITQALVAHLIERRYEPGMLRNLFWIV
jgi:hypothetical protein